MTKILNLAGEILGWALAWVVPRDRGLCVAGAWMGEMYGDNSRYFVEYLLSHSAKRVVWIGNAFVRDRLPRHPRLAFAQRGTWRAAWSALRAKCWIVVQGPLDIGHSGLRGNAVVLNFWHGLAFKRSGATRADGTGGRPKIWPLKTRIVRALTRRKDDEAGWTSVASMLGGRHLAEAFPQYFSTDRLLPFGTPRNDYLIRNRDNESLRRELKARYCRMLGIPADRRIVLYLPTFRKSGARTFSFYALSGKVRDEIANLMRNENAVLVEKHHFLALRENPPPRDASADWNAVVGEGLSRDILTQELLLATDVLVTDYSSVFIDYCLLDRACIHFVYDLEEYRTNDSGLAYDPEEVGGGPCVRTAEELPAALKDALAAKHGYPRPGYAGLVEFERGNACEQIADWLNRS